MEYGPAMDADNVAKAWLADNDRQFGHFINNEWHKPQSLKTVQITNPSSGEVLASVLEASPADVDRAARAAKEAFGTWSNLSDNARSRHLYSIARHVQKHQQLFSVVETLDTGRVMRESRDTEVPQAVRLLYHFTGWAQLRQTELQGYKPYGVVAIIPSFSRPLVSLVQRLAVALATGNTVVVCPNSATPLSALLLASVCREAGLPGGVVNVVTDGPQLEGRHKLVTQPEVDKVAFCGSNANGRAMRELLAGSGRSLSLELGGSGVMVVLDSADLDSAVEGVVDAAWGYQGQLNTSVTRLLVQEPVFETFSDKLRQRLEKLRVGDSLEKNSDCSALTNPCQQAYVQQAVEEARQEGAQVYQASVVNSSQGSFFPPTLVLGAQTASRVFYDDVWGPVVTAVPFRTAKEAVTIANHSTWATGASVWSEDVSAVLEVAALLKAGTVWVNSHNTFDAAVGAGGDKLSGSGRVGGRRGLLEFMRPCWAERANPDTSNCNLATFGSNLAPRPVERGAGGSGDNAHPPRIDQTYKLYYGGAQKRPDGQYSRPIQAADGSLLGHVSEASRKDVRNAVEAAQKAFAGWSGRVGHNRAQILYYIAENLELRKDSLAQCLEAMSGQVKGQGLREVDLSLQRLFHWAAYCDKYGGSVQEAPINGRVYETNEPVGVVAVACPDNHPLLAFVSLCAAAIARGNAVVMVPSQKFPLAAAQLYQVFDTSDLPGGVVNILTGSRDHLTRVLAEHHDVQAVWYFGSPEGSKFVEHAAASSAKRTWVNFGLERDFADPIQGCGEEFLFHATQPKSVWIPTGGIFAN